MQPPKEGTAPEPLWSKGVYGRFESLVERLGPELKIFVPIGYRQGSVRPRILFYGQATSSYHELAPEPGFEAAAQHSAWALADNLAGCDWTGDKAPNQGKFWPAVSGIAARVFNTLGRSTEEAPVSVGWSNVVKISRVGKGNPQGNLLRAQFDLCAEVIAQEIEVFKPDLTVVLVGGYAQEIVERAFQKSGWKDNTQDKDHTSFKVHPRFGPVIWGPHPGDQDRARSEISFIAGLAAGVLLHSDPRTPPPCQAQL